MRSLLALVPATLFLALVPAAGRAETIGTPAVEGFWGGELAGFEYWVHIPGPATVGYSFKTNRALTVVSLGSLDLSLPTNVRLYDGAGDLLASAAVSASDQTLDAFVDTWQLDGPHHGAEPFKFHPLANPVLLDVNKTYYVVADVTNWRVPLRLSVSTDPAISLTLQAPPGADFYGFGPNFGIQIPEPGSAILLLAGAALLLLYKLRRRAVHVRYPRNPYVVFWVPKRRRL